MTGWLKLTDEQRRVTLVQAQVRTGTGTKSIEKDWWVTLVLKTLFQSKYGQHLVFKGGTSLSKGWKLINRFSEDIDIALDPAAFGMEYKEHPSRTYVNELKRTGCLFTSNELRAELIAQLAALGVPANTVTVDAEPIPEKFPDTDPQTLHVKYTSLYDPIAYITDEVKIEVSVRSLRMPFTTRPILSILSEAFPNPAYKEQPFTVTIVEPRKTFLEKTFLLHEEFGKPDKSRIRHERMSRHLYDLVMMMDTRVGTEALADHDLYDHLISHRQSYSRVSWVNYSSLVHTTLLFLPPAEKLDQYRDDYAAMQETMIYGDAPSFDELINKMKYLLGRFRLKKDGRSLETVLSIALRQAAKLQGDTIRTTVAYILEPSQPEGPTNDKQNYLIEFSRNGGTLLFESIAIKVN